jgi:WD40 repeat protein
MSRLVAVRFFGAVVAGLLVVGCGGGSGGGPATLVTDSPVVVSTASLPDGALTYPYTGYGFAVASGGSPPFTWAITKGTPPPGLTLGSDGSLSGAPTALGSFSFTVTATDSAPTPVTGSQQFTVKINRPAPLVISATPAPPAGVADSGYNYYFTFTTTSPTGGYQPLNWAVTAGALPPGLTLATNGLLSGTPTTIGSYPFTVTVTDSAPTPEMNSASFTIQITTPSPPTINNTPPPTATVGTAYPAFQFTATSGYLPLVWGETGALPAGLSLSAGGVLSGTAQTDGQFPITLNVKDALNRPAPAVHFTVRVSLARPAAGFIETAGGMTIARSGHSATLLQTGKVLIAGGPDATAELYDPASETFIATGSMTVARSGHTATLLGDSALPQHGYVLVAAGGSQTAELYDPASGKFTATGSMLMPHGQPTATLLQTGRVLIAGGGTTSAELYNPATGTFTATGSMLLSLIGHTATLLTNGQVLITGGDTPTGSTSEAEIYDPASGKFTSTGSMSEGRSGHTATLLLDGTVLVTGTDNSAELFSPGTGTFSVVGELLTQGSGTTATLRKDGTVLVAGGRIVRFSGSAHQFRAENSIAAAELFATESEGFTATGSLRTPRDGHTATLLVDGTVLVAGGATHSYNCRPGGCWGGMTPVVLSSAELFK